MKLRDFLKYFDGLDYIVLWHEDEPEEPVYEGTIFDVPFGGTNCKLTSPNKNIHKWDGIHISKIEDRANDVLIVHIGG